MLSIAALVLGVCLGTPPPSIAIVIDDLGNRPHADQRALALRGPLTYAILPFSPASRELAREVRLSGREILLHLPMEADTHNRLLGPGALRADMDHGEFSATVQRALGDVPYLTGVNNHMGSLLTRDRERMDWLMAELRAAGNLLYLDSRTTSSSVAAVAARAARLPSASRDVFLDNRQSADHVHRQFERLIALAEDRGDAIAIAHPYPVTVAVLAERLDDLRGTRLVSLTELLRQRACRASARASAVALPARSQGQSDGDESGRAE